MVQTKTSALDTAAGSNASIESMLMKLVDQKVSFIQDAVNRKVINDNCMTFDGLPM